MADRIFVVTGAAGALGRVVVERLAADGEVVAIDLAAETAFPGAVALALSEVDLTLEGAAQAAFAKVRKKFGRIDGLANVAGGFAWETVAEGSAATWERLFALNVKTALNACRAALPLLGEGGGIVNVGAASAGKAEAGLAAYAAAKSGVARLTEGLAAELKEQGIRVNAVLPSIIDTPANRAEMPHAMFARWVRPDELADVIAFLLSRQASAITGALLPVTGRV